LALIGFVFCGLEPVIFFVILCIKGNCINLVLLKIGFVLSNSPAGETSDLLSFLPFPLVYFDIPSF